MQSEVPEVISEAAGSCVSAASALVEWKGHRWTLQLQHIPPFSVIAQRLLVRLPS